MTITLNKKLIIKTIFIFVWLYSYVLLAVWFERKAEIREPVFYMVYGSIMFFINVTAMQMITKWQTPKWGRRKSDLPNQQRNNVAENVKQFRRKQK